MSVNEIKLNNKKAEEIRQLERAIDYSIKNKLIFPATILVRSYLLILIDKKIIFKILDVQDKEQQKQASKIIFDTFFKENLSDKEIKNGIKELQKILKLDDAYLLIRNKLLNARSKNKLDLDLDEDEYIENLLENYLQKEIFDKSLKRFIYIAHSTNYEKHIKQLQEQIEKNLEIIEVIYRTFKYLMFEIDALNFYDVKPNMIKGKIDQLNQ